MRKDELGWSGRWISLLLRLFPGDFRRRLGDDLLTAFLDQRDARAKPHRAAPTRTLIVALTTLRVTWQLAKAGVGERLASWRAHRGTAPNHGDGPMKSLWLDTRHALRCLRRDPVFTAVVVLTVALGIGANTAIFTVVNGVLLRPLPYDRPEDLVMVNEVDLEGKTGEPGREYALSPANLTAWQERTSTFTDIAAVNYWLPTLTGDGPAEPLTGAAVTTNTFTVLGVAPALGSGFGPEHGVPGNDRVVVLSHGFWERRFGGDREVVGRTIRLNGSPYTILGVMPESYRHPALQLLASTQVIRPLAAADPSVVYSRSLRGVARLRPGTSIEAARGDLEAVARRMEIESPETNQGWGVVVKPLREELFGGVRGPLLIFLGGAAIVLLIVFANVANLVLARSQGRRREFAIRTTLGAGRTRLARHLVVESLILTLSGGLLGLAAVHAGMDFLLTVQSQYISSVAEIRVDVSVVGFMMALALITGIVFGLLPVLRSSGARLSSALMEDSARTGVSGRTRRVRSGLVMAQVVLANILVVGGCLMTRSFARLVNVGTGFEAEEATVFFMALPPHYQDPEVVDFHDRLRAGLSGIPGLRSVALVSDLPFQRENRYQWVSLQDDGQTSGDRSLVEYRRVGPGYFRTMGIGLVSGREFLPQDGREGVEVPVIVNERMVARYWPNQYVLGASFRAEGLNAPARIVGVVADVLDDGLDGEVEARFYEPFFHRPTRGATVVLRASVEPAPLVAAARSQAEALESDVLVTRFRRMDDLVGTSLADDRIALTLAVVFSTLALLLAAVGLYGLMSYTVSQRQQEIGVRSALGARQADVMRLVLGQSGRLTLVGTIVGIGLALPLARFLSAFLFGIRPADPVTFILVPLILLSVGLLSSYLPARRAARISPAETLREIR